MLWPAHGAPVIVSAYLTESAASETMRDTMLADVALAVVSAVRL